jgi:hypothetical protein
MMASNPHGSIGSNHADHGAQQTNIVQFVLLNWPTQPFEATINSAIEMFQRHNPLVQGPEGTP